MTPMRMAKGYNFIPFLFVLFGCSDSHMEIVDANMPYFLESSELHKSVWAFVVHTKGDHFNDLKDSDTFYLFKKSCDNNGRAEEIGYIIDNKNSHDNKWIFAVDDAHLSNDRYTGISKGDCVFIKTSETYKLTTPSYASNSLKLR